jgi:hypothetical protein
MQIDRPQPEPTVLLELRVVEQRYQAAREVLDGASGRSPEKEALPLPVKSCYALGWDTTSRTDELAHLDGMEDLMRQMIVVALVAIFAGLMLLPAGVASADPNNRNTLRFVLDCDTAGTVEVVFELSSADSFHVVGTSSNFLWKSLDYVTPDGQAGRIERGVQGSGHDLVTCTYTGAVSGNHYTATGFFTP